ncbi:hypothetical protein ALT717_10228 [Alteromonas macleodii]|nr:hypothetical protein [Alteromonas macleodii]|tara:strand:- start:196 stop:342 length:147 start_codon:yes stop_codon:yes gene_type:complete
MTILKQNEGLVMVPDLVGEHGMLSAKFSSWRSTYGGMDTSMMNQMKKL